MNHVQTENNRVVIELVDACVAYDNPGGPPKEALRGVTLEIREGEFVALVGPNGSGKSTLSKLLNGLLIPTEGTVRVRGLDTQNARNLHEIRRIVGMVFQDPENQMVSTIVEDDVAFGLENYGVPYDEMVKRVEEALVAVGMWEHRRRPPHQLSGGQKQRVAIASVVAMRPHCIVFDEATSMLDVEGRESVMEIVRTLHNSGHSIVMVTHHMEEALEADRIVVMKDGRVLKNASPRDVFCDEVCIRDAMLEAPIATDVAARLVKVGWPVPDSPLTSDELVTALRRTIFASASPPRRPNDTPVSFPSFEAKAASRKHRASAFRDASDDAGGPLDHLGVPLIRIQHLTHTYMRGTPMERKSLRDVSVDIPAGQFVAIVGHTGSGKSTLIQHLNGLIRPQEGSVVVDGLDTSLQKTDLRALRRIVGLAFQSPEDQLFEPLIGDDVAFGPFQYGMTILEARERVKFAMEAVGLGFDWRDRSIYNLSGGERRKVALAGVLAMKPKVLILDEPTSGLDPQSRSEIAKRLVRLQNNESLTVIWVTHQLEEAAQFADRILVMDSGEIVLDSSPAQLFADVARLSSVGLRLPEAPNLVQHLNGAGFDVDPSILTRDQAWLAVDDALRRRMGESKWKS